MSDDIDLELIIEGKIAAAEDMRERAARECEQRGENIRKWGETFVPHNDIVQAEIKRRIIVLTEAAAAIRALPLKEDEHG